MANVDEIKKELDSFYSELTGLKNIGAEDAKKVSKKINELLMCQDNASLVANELFRFPKSIFVRFFKDMSMSGCDKTRVTNLFRSLSQSNKWKDSRQLAKLKDALIELHCKKCCIEGMGLLTAVFLKRIWFDGKMSMNEKINQLSSFIHRTKGRIYTVEYLDCKRTDIEAIRDITLKVFGDDLTRSEYFRLIRVWFEKYGFEIPNNDNVKEKTEPSKSIPYMEQTSVDSISKPVVTADKALTPKEGACIGNQADKRITVDMAAFAQKVKSISDEECAVLLKAISGLRDNITEANRIHRENAELKVKVSELETKIASATGELAKTAESLTAVKAELDECREKSVQQAQQIEYLSVMSRREDEQAVLSLKNNLVGSLRLCYEDWQEYSDSECTENNYQSLLIILKKIFKSLEKNGILFEE